MRLENRGRVKPGDPPPGPGTLRRVLISDVEGEGNGPRGSYLLGIPEKPITEIAFSRVRLRQYPWEGPAPDAERYPDFRGAYPDAHMIDAVGPAPACGLWTRHTRGVVLKDYQVLPDGPDPRPALLQEDA